MKAKILIMLMMIITLVSSIWIGKFESQAEDMGEDIDYSYLLTDDALVGYTESQTWGIYLLSGHSVINKISSTKIGAGGVTNAAKSCDVSVTSIVERKTSTGWARVTSWSQSNEDAYSAGISKSLYVATGYYYRVRSYHYAETDASNSGTDALWIGN